MLFCCLPVRLVFIRTNKFYYYYDYYYYYLLGNKVQARFNAIQYAELTVSQIAETICFASQIHNMMAAALQESNHQPPKLWYKRQTNLLHS